MLGQQITTAVTEFDNQYKIADQATQVISNLNQVVSQGITQVLFFV